MIKDSLTILIICAFFSTCPLVVRADTPDGSRLLVQSEGAQDFEDWYETDESVETDDVRQPEGSQGAPGGGESEPRVAPDEDTRPMER